MGYFTMKIKGIGETKMTKSKTLTRDEIISKIEMTLSEYANSNNCDANELTEFILGMARCYDFNEEVIAREFRLFLYKIGTSYSPETMEALITNIFQNFVIPNKFILFPKMVPPKSVVSMPPSTLLVVDEKKDAGDDTVVPEKAQGLPDVTAKLEEKKTPDHGKYGKYVEYFSKYIVLREKFDDLTNTIKRNIIASQIDQLNDSIVKEDFNLADSLIAALNLYFEKIKDQHDSKKVQEDKLAWWDSLERLKVPHIGRLADHIIQNGLGEVECSTKKLIFHYGTKMIASWWDEYRGEKIDF